MNKETYIEHLKHLIHRLEKDETFNWTEHLSEYGFLFLFYPYSRHLHNDLSRELRDDLHEIKENISEMKNFYADSHDNFTQQFIVSKEEVKYLEEWLKDCKTLTICDACVFSENVEKIYDTIEEYCDTLTGILPQSLQNLKIHYNPENEKSENPIKANIKKYCESKRIYFDEVQDMNMHNRVWIKDDKEALVIGTSFNGLGNKLAFILDLPQDDLERFKEELQKIK